MVPIATGVDGLLLVDKPAGVSSHDAVLVARRALGEKRIGHAGTLDPFATGLLVMLVGRATRLLPYVPDEPKVYDVEIAFGSETDTEDLLGTVTRTAAMPSRRAVMDALPGLTGDVAHVPPAFSAKRVGGRRAYAMARSGEPVELKSVRVRVDAWDALAWDGTDAAVSTLRARITCGGGTYVRALARDLGRASGSAAHVKSLRRVRAGVFDVADALSLGDVQRGGIRARPALDALPHVPRVPLDDQQLLAIVRGQAIDARTDAAAVALTNAENGVLVAYAERKDAQWWPRVVMRAVDDGGGVVAP